MLDRRIRSAALTECGEINQRKSKMLNRALRSNARDVLFLVLVLSIAVLVLVLEAVWYSNPAHWFASCRDGIGQRLASPRFEEPSRYSYSYSKRFGIAIRLIGPQVAATASVND